MNTQKIAAAEAAVREARKSLQAAEDALRKIKGQSSKSKKHVQTKKIRFLNENEIIKSKTILKDLITTDEWPQAIHPRFISNPEDIQQQLDRSRSILESLMEGSISGKKFLDYGCESGLTTFAAMEMGATLAVGYDIREYGWEPHASKNRYCTVLPSEVRKQAPYDLILVYDVLDHVERQSPKELLTDVRKNCSKDTIVHIRVHPMCSRHGCHSVHSINKAYSHLFFTKEELEHIFNQEIKYIPNSGALQPLRYYDNLFQQAGFRILNYHVIKDPAEPFFEREPMRSYLSTKFNMNQFPSFQLSVAFIDYVLMI